MSNFLFNLAQRGAGLAPAMTAQPEAMPPFAAGLHTVHPAQLEDTSVGGTASEIPTSGVTASTHAPLVERPGPQHPRQPSPSQFRAGIATTHEWESWPNEPSRPRPQSDQISNPQRAPKPASMPVDLRSEEAPPLGLATGSKVAAEPAEPSASIRVTPQIQEASSLEAVSDQPAAPMPDATPSGRASGSQARLLTRLTPAEPTGRSQTLSGALDEIETVLVATPAIIQPPSVIRQTSGQPLTSALSGNPSGTPSVPQPIQVRIGTIEVRATTPPTTPPPAPAPHGFDDYATIRSYMSWERY
jgi:hypothetical protein